MEPFMAVTAYFIDSNWNLKNVRLDFSKLPHPHNGKAINEKLQSLITEFGLIDRISGVTTDNATNNKSAVEFLQQWLSTFGNNKYPNLHVRCFAHIIKLSVYAGIDELKDEIDTLRNLVSFIRISSKRRQTVE